MSDYQRLRDYLGFKGEDFNTWLTRHRHLTLGQRQTAYANFITEMQPVAHELRVYEEAAAYRKELLETEEWRGIA